MSHAFETPELFDDLGISGEQVALRKPVSRKKVTGRSSAKQLRMFTEASGNVRDGVELDLEPLDATFRDSSEAPLHSWFPYLEGYSPRFVERVRHEYLRDAQRIIEPFAGSGTTPIVLGQSGIECAFSEANPAMVFIAQTKLAVLRLEEPARKALARSLTALAVKLPQRVAASVTDEGLRASYATTFGASVFFDEPALDAVLRLRTVNDELIAKDRLLGDCFAVAVLSSLIPSSRLKRAGDLRYRTPKELAAGLPHPVEQTSSRLIAQAEDLEQSEPLKAEARFACATAGALHEHLGDGWDGVITSPPYLNGTNYIRNARLELWYLRHLGENADLRRLRDRVITSGINDVHAQTRWEPVTLGVERVVRAIEANAYDSRIAKMVGGYFHDMAAVFSSLGECLRPGGRLCIDIGDSIYNRVHVPTDDLLVEVAESMGYKTVERVHLRKRISKGGEAVRQQLLVFERPKKLRTGKPESATKATQEVAPKTKLRPEWRTDWEVFKKTLPHQLMPYSKREWGGPAHSMCSYQGKMKPALAHHLVKCFSAPGDVVLDPFSGAGTIPLEACRMGRRGYGIDISRLGHVLTLAKVAKTSPVKMEELLRELEASIKKYRLKTSEVEQAAEVRFNSAIPDYFHPETLQEVIAARSFFLSRWDSGPEWAVLFSCTLHLLHGNRPYALSRRSHPVTPFKPTGNFEHRELMPRLRDKLARLHEELTNDAREWGGSAQGDCTVTWPASIPTADVIITSPPFFDSTRFYMTNWMRFWFVGWERGDFDTRASEFLETRQKQNLDVYHSFYAAARERLRAGGLLVLHLGNSAKCDMGAELSKRVAPWFSVADVFTEGVEHCESHGIRDKGTVHGHTYLVLVAN
ncbi:DNA methyltransferase [Aquincola sp. MAHUQ-54]|uniref:DNA methyltransferase n=1 Tax=Aquincola agrisoli TaxID=3119538 RepID=A0AAW9QLC2_9BURK